MQEKSIHCQSFDFLFFSSNSCLPLKNLLRVKRLLSSSASCLEFPDALSIVDNFEEIDYLPLIPFEQFLMHRILVSGVSHFFCFFFFKLRLAASLQHTS
jgi:hypothetical protein